MKNIKVTSPTGDERGMHHESVDAEALGVVVRRLGLLAERFTSLGTEDGQRAAVACVIAQSYAVDLAAQLTLNPGNEQEALAAAARGGQSFLGSAG